MVDEDRAEVVRRLARIEERLDRLDRALGFLGPAPSPTPPPVLWSPPAETAPTAQAIPDFEAATTTTAPAVTPAPRPVEQPAAKTEDLEYQIGARVLPVVAALFILGAIGFLVSLGFSRGLITPPMLFGGVCVGCVAFIVVGLIKQDEREQFGQILIGIGSCGLYLNFVAGHVFQHLYEANLLVALFVGLSLINLAYAWWRASQAFLAIGLAGGFAASLMPLAEGKTILSLGLHFLILVPFALLCLRHGWRVAVVLGYLASYGCLLLTRPIVIEATMALTMTLVAVALGVAALITASVDALVAARSTKPPRPELAPLGELGEGIGPNVSVPVQVCLGGLTAYSIPGQAIAPGLIALGLGLASALVGYALAKRGALLPLLGSASFLVLLVAPNGLTGWWPLWAFTALAIVIPLVGLRYASLVQACVLIAMGDFVLAVIHYLGIVGARTPPVWWMEAASLVGLVAASLSSTALLRRSSPQETASLELGAYLLILPMFLRFAYLLIQPGLGGSDYLAFTISLATYAGLGGVIGLRGRQLATIGTAWVLLVAGGVTFVVAAGDTYLQDGTWASIAPTYGLPFGVEWPILAFFALVAGLLANVSGRVAPERDRPFYMGLAALIEGALAARFLYLALGLLRIGEASAYTLAPTLAALLLYGVGQWRRWGPLAQVAAIYMTLGTLAWFDRWFVRLPSLPPLGPWAILMSLVTSVLVCAAIYPRPRGGPAAWYASLLVWVHVSALGQHWLGPLGLGLSLPASVSTTWTAVALILLATGLAREVPELRYAALILLGVTASKIVLVDLAEIDQAIKVIVMLFLGLVMLGGGYWYIRRERARTAVAPSSDSPTSDS